MNNHPTSRLRFFPLGYPVEFESASSIALEVAAARWSATPQLFDEPPLHFKITVTEGPAATASPDFLISPEQVSLKTGNGDAGTFSLANRCGQLQVSTGTLNDREWFRYHVLEALVLTALDAVHFDPVHAACVSRSGTGILLCGDSGAGKTTLAYACARAGWTLVSEDGVHLSDHPSAWAGGFWRFSLREPVRSLFPELRDLPSSPMPNGKFAIPVDAQGQGMSVAWSAEPGPIVLLQRGPGPARLSPAPEADAMPPLLEVVRRPDRASAERRMRAALQRGCWHLHYQSLPEAISLLEGLL